MDELTPCKLRGRSNMLLLVFHAIWRQISSYYFSAISSGELSVFLFCYVFFLLRLNVSENMKHLYVCSVSKCCAKLQVDVWINIQVFQKH